jgi:transcriptional regulator
VPTWNYSEVHLRGAVTVHDDPDWVLDVVTRLTERHEAHREGRWHVADAPEKYLRGQLLGIVGVEVVVESVEGKAKLGQNRSDADRVGAVAGLRAEPGVLPGVVADAMEKALEH